ncbi:MAG: hypothetical protein JOY54_06665 [Acidobacteriaceae bacterium]|nr:hypothetical protein [Acidobacteriaceae bacterium]
MNHITPAALTSWQNFYEIVGSSAGALTGLQFVVITLVTQTRSAGSMRDIHAFGTPTVIHLCTALLISAVMAAPWQTLVSLAVCLAAFGVAGIGYSFRVFWHARKAAYRADVEDWVWYLAFPLLAHLALVGAAVLIWWNVGWALAVVAGDAVMFLLLGVHNSWDTVTFIAVRHGNPSSASKTKDPVEPTSS